MSENVKKLQRAIQLIQAAATSLSEGMSLVLEVGNELLRAEQMAAQNGKAEADAPPVTKSKKPKAERPSA